MTRETKIGLLVGLAFIILFGIILSEKGAGPQERTTFIAAHSPPVVEILAPPETVPGQPTHETADTDHPTSLEPSPVNVRPGTPDQPSPLKNFMPPQLDKAVAKVPPPSPDRPDPVELKAPATDKTTPARVEKKQIRYASHLVEPGQTLAGICRNYYPGRTYRMIKTVMAINAITEPARLLAGQTLKIPIDEPAQTATVRQMDQTAEMVKPRPRFASHEVQPGETLAGICHKYYPGQAYNMVSSVMKLNNIARPELLRAGQTLKIPRQAGTASAPKPPTKQPKKVFVRVPNSLLRRTRELQPQSATTTLVRKALPPARATKSQPKFYIVQPNDTLSSVAKRFYGRESIWPQLYKHNRNVIPDPHRMRSGLKLRLPQLTSELAVSPSMVDSR